MNPDSGIAVRSDSRDITRKILPSAIIYPFQERPPIEGEEIIYWRKNYGLCEAIDSYLADNRIIKTPEQIYQIIKIIVNFMNKKVWEKQGNSMWSYKEVLPYLRQNINNLVVMINFMEQNPDVYLEFYN